MPFNKLLASISILTIVSTAACSKSQDSIPSLELTIKDVLRKNSDAGLSVGIVEGSEQMILCQGFADKAANIQVRPETIFEIGSITKLFTNLVLAENINSGTMNLEESICNYLAKGLINENTQKITLKGLATHSSGLPRLADNFEESVRNPDNPYISYTENELNSYLQNINFLNPPGLSYHYSNVGVGILGYALSKKENLSYNDLISQKVCRSFNLSNTSTNLTYDQKKNLASGYSGYKRVGNWDFLDVTAGQGALKSDVLDMLSFMKFNLYPETSDLQKSIELTQEVQFTDQKTGQKMGLGWHIGTFNSRKYLEHTGGTGGYRSFIGIIPEMKIGVVILSNSDKDVSALGIELLKLVVEDYLKKPLAKN